MTRQEMMARRVAKCIMEGNGPLSYDIADFILEHFEEKPKPSARERLKTLLCDRIPGVRLGDEDTVALYLLDECKELLSILEQYSEEVLREAITRNAHGFGV